MNDSSATPPTVQQALFEEGTARSLLDRLLSDSRLYTKSKDYKDLLDFVVRLRNFAPFNAMLLHVQKPGLSYAASAADWRDRYGRWPKDGARPLLILWPFGPVALVYDVQDTDGKELPQDVECFPARGPIDKERIGSFTERIRRKSIDCHTVDAGDAAAGSIRIVKRALNAKETTLYRMLINRNQSPATQFVTIAHELGHLLLGHLGPDKALGIPERAAADHVHRELEAESVAFLVSARNGVESKSERYLSKFVAQDNTIDEIDLYQVMRAAGQVETLLGLTAQTKWK